MSAPGEGDQVGDERPRAGSSFSATTASSFSPGGKAARLLGLKKEDWPEDADVNEKDNDERTALVLAAMKGKIHDMRELLHARADVDSCDMRDKTALHYLAIHGRADAVEQLLGAKANIVATGKDKMTPLQLAVLAGHKEVVEKLATTLATIDGHKEEKHGKIYFKDTPLDSKEDTSKLTGERLPFGSTNPQKYLHPASIPALHLAVAKGNLEVLEALVNSRADVNSERTEEWDRYSIFGPLGGKGKKKCTALYDAVNKRFSEEGSLEVLQKLLDLNADPNTLKGYALRRVVRDKGEGNVKAMEALMKANADPTIPDADGISALHVIAVKGDKAMFQKIIELMRDSDFNKLTSDFLAFLLSREGETPIAFVEMLLKEIVEHRLDENHNPIKDTDTLPKILDDFDDHKAYFEFPTEGRLRGRMSTAILSSHPKFDDLISAKEGQAKWDFSNYSDWLGKVYDYLDWLFPAAPVVKAKLWHSPVVDAQSAHHVCVMEAIANSSNMELLETNFVAAIVNEGWKTVEVWAYVDIVLNVSAVVAAMFAAQGVRGDGSKSTVALIWLACVTAKRIVEEIFQCFHTIVRGTTRSGDRTLYVRAISRYVLRVDTVIDVFFIVGCIFGLFFLNSEVHSSFRVAISMWFGTLWMRLLYSLRFIKPVGLRFLPVFEAVMNSSSFLIIVVFGLAAGAHAYYTLGLTDEPHPPYPSVLKMFRLGFLGDFDLEEFAGDDAYETHNNSDGLESLNPKPSENYWYAHGLFGIVAVGVTVILMNLFIGVLSNAYDSAESVAPQIFLKARAFAVVNYQILPWVNCRYWSRLECCSRTTTDPEAPSTSAGTKKQGEVLYAIVLEEPSEYLRSIRSCLKSTGKKLSTRMGMVEEDLNDLKKIMQQLSSRGYLRDEVEHRLSSTSTQVPLSEPIPSPAEAQEAVYTQLAIAEADARQGKQPVIMVSRMACDVLTTNVTALGAGGGVKTAEHSLADGRKYTTHEPPEMCVRQKERASAL